MSSRPSKSSSKSTHTGPTSKPAANSGGGPRKSGGQVKLSSGSASNKADPNAKARNAALEDLDLSGGPSLDNGPGMLAFKEPEEIAESEVTKQEESEEDTPEGWAMVDPERDDAEEGVEGGGKRGRDDEPDDDEEASSPKRNRRLVDRFDSETARIARATRTAIRIHVATVDGFPSKDEAAVKEFIKKAVQELACPALTLKLLEMPEETKDLLVEYASNSYAQIRGEIKMKAKRLISLTYGIPDRFAGDADAIREAVAWLLKGNFTKGGLDVANRTFDDTKPYGVPLLIDIIVSQWFATGHAEGINAFTRDAFVGMPTPVIALVVSALENALQEWETGKFVSIQFSKENCARSYRIRLRKLQQSALDHPCFWKVFRNDLYERSVKAYSYLESDGKKYAAVDELAGFNFAELERTAQVVMAKKSRAKKPPQEQQIQRNSLVGLTQASSSDDDGDADATATAA